MIGRNKEKGWVLVAAIVFSFILILLGIGFFSLSHHEFGLVGDRNAYAQALYVSEAGIERTLFNLRKDFVNDPDPYDPPSPWADGYINGIAAPYNTANFYPLPYPTTSLGEGSYDVKLKNIDDDEIWVKSTGTVKGIERTVQVKAKMTDISSWNNAITAGRGAFGGAISGNAKIAGSVHILGEGLSPSDKAIDMGGTAGIRNNYDGIPNELKVRIPWVETLEATLRVKHGEVWLSGTATVGESGVPVDGVYVTDGYGGNKGAANVYSNNGTANGYDLGDAMAFPRLNDPYEYEGYSYSKYQDYLKANALVISNPDDLAKFASITPNSSFNYSSAKGSVSMDGSGNLTISGIVYLDGGNLKMNIAGSEKTITYSGSGSFLVTGNAEIYVNLLTPSFPENAISVMTPGQTTIGDAANIDVMGIFYAEDKITCNKQTNIAGTIVSSYFDMGSNVPAIYQVPSLIRKLPKGTIAGTPVWKCKTSGWKES